MKDYSGKKFFQQSKTNLTERIKIAALYQILPYITFSKFYSVFFCVILCKNEMKELQN
jgi:hypothetical protein